MRVHIRVRAHEQIHYGSLPDLRTAQEDDTIGLASTGTPWDSVVTWQFELSPSTGFLVLPGFSFLLQESPLLITCTCVELAKLQNFREARLLTLVHVVTLS